MANLKLKNIKKSFADQVALDDLNLDIADGEFFVILGHTGSGKTTTLRCIAGLERPEQGEIYMDDELISDMTPANRDVAFVFQEHILYPHMTVYENMAFPLHTRGYSESEINSKVVEIAEMLHIEHLLERQPSQLSGGETQRVGLGRAMVRQPKVFLMDEPISALDAKLRAEMRSEIRLRQRQTGITTLYVTHDQTEAMSMADKIVLMNEGHIVQQGKPKELFENPSHMFTAKFLGNPPMNIIETQHDGETHFINHNGEKIDFRQDNKKDLVFGLRPEDIKVSDKGIKCNVNFLDYQGSETIINTTLGIHEINIKTDSKKTDDLNQEIYIKWNKKDIKVFEK